jgi:ankyrin repeat protein
MWSNYGVFLAAFRYQSHLVASDILDVMLEHKMDLNYHVTRSCDGLRYLIDVVAKRGDEILMRRLIEEKVQLTGDTLPYAISSGNEDLVLLLLQHGAEVNRVGDLGSSPLAAAIRLQSASMQALIVDKLGISTSSEKPKKAVLKSVLEAASEVGDLQWIEILVQIGVAVRPADLGAVLIIAARERKRDIALALLDASADTHIESNISSQYPPILEALRQRDTMLVRALLDAGANINCDWAQHGDDVSVRRPAIEFAVSWGDIEVVKLIIRAGANINACHDQPALNFAVERKDYALFDLLIKGGCNINNPVAHKLKKTALNAAVESADIVMIHHVIAHGADVHDPVALAAAYKQGPNFLELLLQAHKHRYPKGRPGWGTSVLNSVIELNDFDLFRKLMDGGADANQFVDLRTSFGNAIQQHQTTGLKFVEFMLQEQRRTGCTPETNVRFVFTSALRNQPLETVTAFLAAIRTKSRPLVDLMLRHHADINFPAAYGIKRTPLQQAAEVGSDEILRLFLARGANVNGAAAQRGGGTALQFAAIGGFIPMARLLLELGAEVDAPGSKVNGRTALEGAAWQGRLDMVAMLLKAGAALEGNDQAQIQRAIAFAEENGHSPIAKLLTHYGQTKRLSSIEPSPFERFAEDVFDFQSYGMNQEF